MTDQKLSFLDTLIYFRDGNLELNFYKKPTASNVTMNFVHAVAPLKYKISALCGEIYRVARCTTTEVDRENALKNLTDLFLKNGYPKKMIY